MKKFVASAGLFARKTIGVFAMVLGLFLALAGSVKNACAQSDITSAVTSMSTLWTSIEVIAVGVIVFVVGRKLFRKI